MKKISVAVVGPRGRMGQEILQLLKGHKISFIEIDRTDLKKKKPFQKADVVIDFSSPEALTSVLNAARESQTPVVCGTTGLTEKQKDELKKAANEIPVLWSSNMSLGIAILNEALKSLAGISNFDFQIEEFHHNKKKDRPSGTAITLQDNLKKILKKDIPDPVSIRGGGIFGIHKVFAMSDEEIISFEHTALNRQVFAKGALKAATWILGKEKGFYSMSDVLKVK